MRVLLILVDGMRPDSFSDLPEAQRILERSKYTLNARTVIPPVTLPCHMSLFHSVDPDRHGTTTNTYAPQVRPIRGLCEAIGSSKKSSAMFYSWHPLRDVVRPGWVLYSYFYKGAEFGYAKANDKVTAEAISFLNENHVDFSFLYLVQPDEAGHKHGWMSEQYMDAVAHSWQNIENVINALPEDYTVIITADHGGHQRNHGVDVPEDMTIPLIVCGAQSDRITMPDEVSIKDIAPTVAALFGVDPDPDWEGKSLI